MEPFKIFGNLYFVGTQFVSSHIVDTGEGLILIDSQYPQCVYLLLENIRKVGLDPYDIKYILHSHGHYDHLGGTRALVELIGAKTVLGRPDRDYANGTVDLTWAKELGYEYFEMFEPDILIDDGYVLKLGNTEIRCVSTPGHTPGVMSFFFDVTDGKNTYTAAMFGGAGMNSMRYKFLDAYGLPHSYRDDFLTSLEKVRDEHVDILIGNHPGDAQTAQKYERMLAGEENPFLDPTAWHKRLDYCRSQFDDMVAKGL
jgi:metallo-beta-lactamase class B